EGVCPCANGREHLRNVGGQCWIRARATQTFAQVDGRLRRIAIGERGESLHAMTERLLGTCFEQRAPRDDRSSRPAGRVLQKSELVTCNQPVWRHDDRRSKGGFSAVV